VPLTRGNVANTDGPFSELTPTPKTLSTICLIAHVSDRFSGVARRTNRPLARGHAPQLAVPRDAFGSGPPASAGTLLPV
jgi:hypothetical protein